MIAHADPTTGAARHRSSGERFRPLCGWRVDVAEAVAPALSSSASVWQRSHAVRELERLMVPRFREERARMALLEQYLDRATCERLWAAGALVQLLYEALVQDVRLPLRGMLFADELRSLLRALDRWCEEAEVVTRLAERS